MNLGKMFLALLVLAGGLKSFSMDKVVYGEDDRLEPFEVNGRFFELARSTAAMIPKLAMTEGRNETFEVEYSPLSKRNICQDEKFADQGTPAICSGFLVAPDILVTAGHCADNENYCNDYYWVFDYALTSAGDNHYSTIPKENVYKCKKIYAQELNNTTMMDYAVIILDRPVTNRNHLSINTYNKIDDRTPIVVIGHPSGLPTKIAGGAKVRDNSNDIFFSANLDTFGGNSGSAVFNEKTGQVVGILVRGENDYINDKDRECQVVNRCSDSDCRGEDVTRIENIRQLKTILRERGV